jgi:hypothetical protein
LPRSRRAGAGPSGMWVQGETEGGSSCAIFWAQRNERRQVRRPLSEIELGRFRDLGNGLASFLAFALAANSCGEHSLRYFDL